MLNWILIGAAILSGVGGIPALFFICAKIKNGLAKSKQRNAKGDEKKSHARLRLIRHRYLKYLQKDIGNRLDASIHHARFIDIGLEARDKTVVPWTYEVHDYLNPSASGQKFGTLQAAFEFYEGRLLLLGSPGSGKTTTLLHTASHLLDEALKDDRAPIPLLLNLSKFDNSLRKRNTSRWSLFPLRRKPIKQDDSALFEDWLVERLVELPVGALDRSVARQWVRGDKIALLLDGLDEVNETNLSNLVLLLNETYLLSHPQDILIVCSRTIEYQPLEHRKETRLRLNGAVRLQELDPDRIDIYLKAAKATELRDAIIGDSVLHEMAKTPLTLSMMVLAYDGKAPPERSVERRFLERRKQFLDTYVERMVQRDARRKAGVHYDSNRENDVPTEYPVNKINHYLGWLAIRISERAQTVLPIDRMHSFLRLQAGGTEYKIFSSANVALMVFAFSVVLVLIASATFNLILSAVCGIVAVIGSIASLVQRDNNDQVNDASTQPSQFSEILSAIFLFGWLVLLFGLVNLSISSVLSIDNNATYTGTIVFSVVLLLFSESKNADKATPAPLMPDFMRKLRWLLSCVAPLTVFTLILTRKPHLIALGIAIGSALAVFLTIRREHYRYSGFWSYTVSFFLLGAIAIGAIAFFDYVLGETNQTNFALLLASLAGLVIGILEFPMLVLLLFVPTVVYEFEGPAWGVLSVAFVLVAFWKPLVLNRVERERPTDRIVERLFLNPLTTITLAFRGDACFKYKTFLNYAVHAMLLKRAGVDYEFVHRLLRDHFAIRELVPLLGTTGETQLRVISQLSRQGESGFDALSNLITDPDSRVRQVSVEGLGRIATPKVLSVFKETLTDVDPEVRCTVLRNLQKLDSDSARSILRIGFNDRSPIVRREAIRAMNGRGEASRDEYLLRLALQDPDDGVFQEALTSRLASFSFGQLNPEQEQRTLDRFRQALTSDSIKVRIAAIGAMSIIHTDAFVPDLLQALSDDEAHVKLAALRGLTGTLKLTDRPIVDALLGLTKADNSDVRATAIEMIREVAKLAITEDSALQLREALVTTLTDSENKVRSASARSLGAFPGDKTVESLMTVLDDQISDVRLSVIETLGHLQDERAIDGLMKSLNDKETRAAAAQALGQIVRKVNHKDVITSLVNLVQTGRRRQRIGAVMALAEIGSHEAVPILKKLLDESPNWFVYWLFYIARFLLSLPFVDQRVYAVVALGKIGDPDTIPMIIDPAKREPAKLLWARAAATVFLPQPLLLRELTKFIEKSTITREKAFKILGQLDSKTYRGLLNRLERQKISEAVRSKIYVALGTYSSPPIAATDVVEHQGDIPFFMSSNPDLSLETISSLLQQ